ncbi:MAG TPA: hypothetical protein VIN07_11540 [Flavipsychrobacter sp.]
MLQAGHYALLLVILIAIGWAMNMAAINAGYTTERRERFVMGYTIFMVLWISYVSILAGTGFLADFSLPPKVVVFVILPAFVIITWFFTARKFRDIIDGFPIAFTVYFQSFRIMVELLILGLYKEGLGPELVSFEGRNFDILAGLSAPIVGYLAYSRKVLSHKAVIVWNICCLLLLANIVFIFVSLIVRPQIWGYDSIPISLDFPRLPYVYIAAAFMPAAVFMHVFSIRKSLKAMRGK